MGDDSERADRASDADAGTPDGGSFGGGDAESDPPDSDGAEPTDEAGDDADVAEPAPDDSDPGGTGPAPDDPSAEGDGSAGEGATDPDGPTEVDPAETVDRLREDDHAEEDADSDEPASGPGESAPGGSDGATAGDPDGTGVDDLAADDSDADPDSDPDASGDDDPDASGDDGPDVSAGDDPNASWPADAVTGTDGGTPAAAGDAGASGAADPLAGDGIAAEAPESDEEMPLAAHIEEMIHRLAVVLGVGGIVTLLLYPGADLANSAFGLELVSSTGVIDFLWNTHVPGAPELTDRRPRVYGPLELLLTELKVAALGGLIVGLPVFVYETYLFMRPGLYPTERRYYLAAVPASLVLAFVGIAFAHFLVLPAIFAYFTSYTTGTAVVAFGLKETFNLILILMGYNAVIFQIPLFIMLAIMMNLVTRQWLEARRLLFWGAFLGLAFLVSPDPTGMAPIIIAATMIALFEGTLLALNWTASGSLIPTAEGLAARRPHAAVLAALAGYLLSPLPAPTGYYGLLPPAAVDVLAANGVAAYTPVIIAGVLVGAFELGGLLLRRYGRSQRALRARLAVDTARRPAWLVAAVIGYLGSPDPVALRLVAGVSLPPAVAGGVVVGLLAGYETLRVLLAAREERV